MPMEFVAGTGVPRSRSTPTVEEVVGDDAVHPHCPYCGKELEHRTQYQLWACGDAEAPHFTVHEEIIERARLRQEQRA